VLNEGVKSLSSIACFFSKASLLCVEVVYEAQTEILIVLWKPPIKVGYRDRGGVGFQGWRWRGCGVAVSFDHGDTR
jgi:hypothetical protein